MRTLIVIALVIAGLISCKSQKDDTTFSEEFLMQVASDPLFIAYQETVHTDAENIVLDAYDMEGISKVFESLPFGTNICLSEEAREQFFHLKGGIIYLDNECRRQEIFRKLDAKFNFSTFPEEVTRKINRMYREINQEDIDLRALELYHRKN